MKTTCVSVRKNELNKLGYNDFTDWSNKTTSVYIGRNMNFYVKGTAKSKWANPFSVKTYGREKCLEMYEQYIRNNVKLLNCLSELKDKELGCWCKPASCHGDVLIKLLHELNI